jgi:hypothetical protein
MENSGKAEVMDDVWAYGGNGRNILPHSFGDKRTYFELQEYGDRFLLKFLPTEQVKEALDEYFEKFPGHDPINEVGDYDTYAALDTDFKSAKIITEDAIKFFYTHFGDAKTVNLDDVKDYLIPLVYHFEKNEPYGLPAKDIWHQFDDHSEYLAHAFKTGNAFFTVQEVNHDNGDIGVNFCPDQKSLLNKIYSKPSYVLPGTDIGMAKDFLEGTIRHFDQKQRPEPKDIENYLSTKVSQFKEQHDLDKKQPGHAAPGPNRASDPNIETIRKAGYVQGVCECVAAFGNGIMGKKLLAEMNVTKEMAKKYAHPETYKALEQGIFAPKPEQKLDQAHSRKR